MHQALWTIDDLDHLPDDGNRYELLDGSLLVTPAPNTRHQRAVARLHLLLAAACPSGQEVFFAPVDFVIGRLDVPQPDLILAEADHVSLRGIEGHALLVVEVVSPRTRTADRTLKRAKYAEARVPWYWIVHADEPSVTILRLEDDHYAEEAVVGSSERYDVTAPLAVTIAPADLVTGR